MKKLLALLMLVLPVMGMFNDVEMYSDEMPKSKLIWQGNGSPYKILEKNGFVKCSPFIFSQETYNDSNDVYVKLNKNKNFEAAFFIKYEKRAISIVDLKKNHFYVNDGIFKKDKWNIPRPTYFYTGKEDDAITLSWKYIDFVLHEFPGGETSTPYRNSCIYVAQLFDAIRNKGLENSIVRLLVQNPPNECLVYFIHSSKEEILKNDKLYIFDTIT
jgi:hypothetical protein